MQQIINHKFYFIITVIFLLFSANTKSEVLTAESILNQIKIDGLKTTFDRLWVDEKQFDYVCDMIQTGDSKWFEVARYLKKSSDAASSLSLNYSVARALPKEPEKVLRLIGKEFSIENICTSPFVEPDPGKAENYQLHAIAALKSITAFDLKQKKEECLSRISLPLTVR